MAVAVLDASVIIAFLDPRDALHDASVAVISEYQQHELVIPASCYAEILVGPYRAGADAVAEVEAFLSDFAVDVQPITSGVARAAARLRSTWTSLRLPDAFVLAAGDEIGADVILSGDASWPKISRLVTVVRAT